VCHICPVGEAGNAWQAWKGRFCRVAVGLREGSGMPAPAPPAPARPASKAQAVRTRRRFTVTLHVQRQAAHAAPAAAASEKCTCRYSRAATEYASSERPQSRRAGRWQSNAPGTRHQPAGNSAEEFTPPTLQMIFPQRARRRNRRLAARTPNAAENVGRCAGGVAARKVVARRSSCEKCPRRCRRLHALPRLPPARTAAQPREYLSAVARRWQATGAQ
jgi:hypothetical protein